MIERNFIMADKSRERNNVDLFSDYGLDERQTAIQCRIALSCFKLLFNIGVIMSVIWIVLLTGKYTYEIPGSVVALSYYIAVIACYCVYAVRASKQGVINGISAFSFSTKELGTAVICIIGAVIIPFTSFFDEPWFFSVLLVLAAVRCVIFYFCGKRNFRVLDEQIKEDEEND